MSKNFYILLLLIEYIKNYENILTELYSNSNNIYLINPIEINETFNDNYLGIELNLTTLELIEQKYLYFYYNYEFTPPRITTFNLFFFSLLKNFSLNENNFEIKCLITDINTDFFDIKNISLNESKCFGSFDKNNGNKYEGILKINLNSNNSDIDKVKIVFIIKNEWNALSKEKIFII